MADLMTLPFTIRKATLQDARAIAKVHVQSWQETYRGHLADHVLDRLSVESRTIMWTDAINTARNTAKTTNVATNLIIGNVENGVSSQLFVAEIEGEIVAFASAGMLRHEDQDLDTSIETELYAIYCLNKFQGLGIGKALLEPIVEMFLDRGFHKMLVWVLTTNPSKHFYMHLGASYFSEKELVIANDSYQEQAYVWTSLESLRQYLRA